MIQGLQSWVVNICTAVLFMTAVEIILPDNSMKKYTRFVLGLILITVILNPIIGFISNGVKDLPTLTAKNSSTINNKNQNSNYTQYKEENIKNTVSAIESNLEVSLVKELKTKFADDSFQAEVQVSYNEKESEISIDAVKINMKSKGIEKVKKIEINSPIQGESEATDSKALQVKSYVCGLLNVPEKYVKIIKN